MRFIDKLNVKGIAVTKTVLSTKFNTIECARKQFVKRSTIYACHTQLMANHS